MIAVNLGPLALPVPPLLLLFSVVVGLIVAALVAKKQHSPVTDQLLSVLLVSLVFGRIVFVLRFSQSYDSLWQMLDFRDRGFDLPATLLAAIVMLMLQLKRYPQQRKALLSGALTTVLLSAVLMTVVSHGRQQAQLPDLTLARLDGGQVNLQQNKGQLTVVNLWASWCPPCRREMPVLARAGQNNPDIQFVLVNQQESADTVKQYLTTLSLPLSQVLLDNRGQLPQHFGAYGLPVTLYFDQRGQLVSSHMGELSDATLAAALAKLRNSQAAN
ncbi:TlpA family protein disulfide reductase [Rheinheimera sp.]|uniref:TlpA family protein disulfide reductase n=1 Tax=Rheinheimera sp. TaxID=1869214 RepID=UPI0040489FCC